ncbi:MAG: hypothetical protein GXO24_03455 [Chlorobi bacterium]|nr:hypothetical protein [Chlorobiota bacterium]
MERKAKVAVTTGRTGTRVAEHAGHVKFFKIYEITEDKITDIKTVEVDEGQTLHDMLHRHPIDFTGHPLEDVQIILTGGIGMGAIQKLFSVGKRAYMIAEKYSDEAIDKLLAGTLQALDPREHHHDHHHHDHHHHDHHHHDHHHGHGHDHPHDNEEEGPEKDNTGN